MPDLPATPFDDLDAWAVLRPQDIAERLRVDARSAWIHRSVRLLKLSDLPSGA